LQPGCFQGLSLTEIEICGVYSGVNTNTIQLAGFRALLLLGVKGRRRPGAWRLCIDILTVSG